MLNVNLYIYNFGYQISKKYESKTAQLNGNMLKSSAKRTIDARKSFVHKSENLGRRSLTNENGNIRNVVNYFFFHTRGLIYEQHSTFDVLQNHGNYCENSERIVNK